MPTRRTGATVAAVIACAALVAYVALSYAAPAPTPLWPPTYDASLLERLFPTVPSAWVLARLGAVGVALVFATIAMFCQRGGEVSTTHVGSGATRAAPPWATLACVAGLVHVAAAPFATALPRAGQLAYIAWLGVPTLLLFLGRPRAPAGARTSRATGDVFAVAAVVGGWLVWRLASALHDPLVATPVDSIIPFRGAQQVLDPRFDLLGGAQLPGYTSLLSVLQGPMWLGVDAARLTPQLLQIFQIVWTGIAALLLAYVVAVLGCPGAAPVVAAAYLFAPFTVATTLLLGPIYLGGLLPATALAAAVTAVRGRQEWAIAACAATAGAGMTHPSVAPVCLAIALGTAWSLRGTGLRGVVAVAAVASFVAAVVPGLPSPERLQSMAADYIAQTRMWAGIEAVGFGLIPAAATEFQVEAGWRGPLDTVLGVALSPWATPRTPFRLWGDGIIEPLSAASFTLGVAAAVAGSWRRRAGRAALLLVILALLPGLVASYDRPSLTRALCAPAMIALVAAFGFARLHRSVSSVRAQMAGAFFAAAIAASGLWVVEGIQRRTLPVSSLTIALAEVDAGDECLAATWLRDARIDIQAADFFVRHVPRCAVDVVPFVDRDAAVAALRADDVVFWNPGLEESAAVGRRLCAALPDMQLWTLREPTHRTWVFAAAQHGRRWNPRAEAERHACGATLVTDATRAETALATAAELRAQGEVERAIERVRATARTTFTQASLYLDLAATLCAEGAHGEGAYWGRRAVLSHDWRDLDSIRLLAYCERSAGDLEAARAVLDRGLREARAGGRTQAAEQLAADLGQLGAVPATGP